ncbi:MAG: type II secretion system F family protein [Planctomycetota bacterium]
MIGILVIIAGGIFVASMVALVASAVMPSSENSATEDRLAALASRKRGGADPSQASLLLAGGLDEKKAGLQGFFDNLPGARDYLEQADVDIDPTLFTMICVGCVGGGVFATVVSPLPILLAPVVAAVFVAVPFGYVWFKRKQRLAKFGRQLPEALELLSRSLRAGHSLNAGFGLVAEEMEAPLCVEFARCFEEQKFGIPLDEAIEEMAGRVPNMDLRFFATAVILQRQTGGDLSEILDKIGHLVRERLQILGQIQALTGEGRMSGAVLLGMPPALFLVMLRLNYDYVMMLFTDPLGRYMLGGALVMQFLGAIAIKKIITIKV